MISGYLIFRSWENSKTIGAYFNKRARRILPPYLIVILGAAFGLSLVSQLPWQEYFRHPDFYKYIASHLTFLGFLQNTLPGVFIGHVQEYVNGPLWTIKIEVWFYLVVPLIMAISKRLSTVVTFLGIYIFSIVWYLSFELYGQRALWSAATKIANQLPGQLSFFIAGGMLHFYEDFFQKNYKWLAPLGFLILIIYYVVGRPLYFIYPIYPAALAVTVISFALHAPHLGNWGRFGDFSYGIYIFHYPILQLIASFDPSQSQPGIAFFSGLTITIGAAVLSWNLVEKRWLLASSHYRQASRIILNSGKPVSRKPQL